MRKVIDVNLDDGSVADDVDDGEVQGGAASEAEEEAAGGKRTSILKDILG